MGVGTPVWLGLWPSSSLEAPRDSKCHCHFRGVTAPSTDQPPVTLEGACNPVQRPGGERGPGQPEGGRKAPGWGGRGGLWPGGCCSGRDCGQLPAAKLFCPVVGLTLLSAARSLNAIDHGRSSICRSTPGLPEMKGKHVLFLVEPCPFPGWGKSGSRHSRNIFSVHSPVILKPHLREERRGSEIKRECGR